MYKQTANLMAGIYAIHGLDSEVAPFNPNEAISVLNEFVDDLEMSIDLITTITEHSQDQNFMTNFTCSNQILTLTTALLTVKSLCECVSKDLGAFAYMPKSSDQVLIERMAGGEDHV